MSYTPLFYLIPTMLAFFGYIIRIERTLVKINTELNELKKKAEKWEQSSANPSYWTGEERRRTC